MDFNAFCSTAMHSKLKMQKRILCIMHFDKKSPLLCIYVGFGTKYAEIYRKAFYSNHFELLEMMHGVFSIYYRLCYRCDFLVKELFPPRKNLDVNDTCMGASDSWLSSLLE